MFCIIFFLFSLQTSSFGGQIDKGNINQTVAERSGKPSSNNERKKAKSFCEIKLINNKLYISAKNTPIKELLQKIAEKTDINLKLGKDIMGNITITLKDFSIESAIKRICHNSSIVYNYNPDTKIYSIVSIGVYATSKGKDSYSSDKASLNTQEVKQKIYSLIQEIKNNIKNKDRLKYRDNFGLLRSMLLNFLPSEYLINEINNSGNTYEFRWLMADFLSLYPLSKETDRDLGSVLEQLTQLLTNEKENPKLRKKVIAVLSSCYSNLPKTNVTNKDELTSTYYNLFKKLTSNKATHPLVFGKALSGGFKVCRQEGENGERRQFFKEKALGVLGNYKNHDPFVVRQSMIVLAREKDASGIEETINILDETDNKDIFLSSAFSLSLLGGNDIIKPLVENSARFPNTRICIRALKDNRKNLVDIVSGKVQVGDDIVKSSIRGLGLIKGKNAKSALKTRINDDNKEIRRLAREVLNKDLGEAYDVKE